jgi:hypothetical protein
MNRSSRVDRQSPPAIFRPLRDAGLPGRYPKAPVAELVDALDSKSSSARSAGSIPARGTNLRGFGWRAARAPISDSIVKQPRRSTHRHCDAAKQSILPSKERMDCFAALAMTSNTNSRSRGTTRPSCSRTSSLPNQREQGRPGARCTRGRAWCVVNTRVSHHRFTGTPGAACQAR